MLDEITEMSPAQVALARARVGQVPARRRQRSDRGRRADHPQSNRDLHRSGKSGARAGHYRLNVPRSICAAGAPRRSHRLLAQHFLDILNAAEGTEKRWSPQALRALAKRPWRGNVRELRNAVHKAFILADREINEDAIEASEPIRNGEATSTADGKLEVSIGSEIAAVEKRLILATLDHYEGDKRKAADTLGISLKTLYNRLSVYRAAQPASE
jgi:DNA-binding NtrC family response regulator